MHTTARDSYRATEVRTATPQRLQLLLIEEALRSAHRARQQWSEGKDDWALDTLIHAQEVLSQMLATIDFEVGGDLAKRVAAVYEFIYRKLVEAGYRHSEAGLADAIRVLEIERDTWRQLVDKLAREESSVRIDSFESPRAPTLAPTFDLDPLPAGGFSLDA